MCWFFAGGWVHAVSFSPCGNKICWVAHNSSICVADATKGNAVVRLYTEHLPFLSCVWVGPNSIIAAVNILLLNWHIIIINLIKFDKFFQGHSCMPMLYSIDKNGQLYFVSKLDNSQKREAAGISAMRKFQSLDRQARTEINDSFLDSIHQNAITCVRNMSTNEFSTSGLDGQLVLWDTKVNNKNGHVFFSSLIHNCYCTHHLHDHFIIQDAGKFHRWPQDRLSRWVYCFFYDSIKESLRNKRKRMKKRQRERLRWQRNRALRCINVENKSNEDFPILNSVTWDNVKFSYLFFLLNDPWTVMYGRIGV